MNFQIGTTPCVLMIKPFNLPNVFKWVNTTMKMKITILSLLSLLASCSKVDDFVLGKDNTPKPKPLKELNSNVKISKNWSVPVGKGKKNNEYLKLKAVEHSGVIYTADASGLIQAVNKSDGALKWSTQLNHKIISGPAVSNNYLAVSTNASTLAVFSRDNGKELWQKKVSSEILSPPAIAHNKVITKTIDGKVIVFDANSGSQVWTVDHGSPSLVLKASSSPIVLGNLVLIGFSDGKLDAYEIDTGHLAWQRSIAYATGTSDVERLIDIDSDPIIKDNVAYIATYQGYIGALSLNDGQFLWKKPASVYKNMLLAKNSLYLTDANDVVWSLNSHNGNVNWKQSSLKARGLTEPVMMGKKLVVGDKTGYLHVLSTQTGELLGRSQLASGVSISPSVVDKKLYVLTDNGMLNNISVS